jgi:hypothetical protein
VIGGRMFIPSWVPVEWREPLVEIGVTTVDVTEDDPIEVVGLSADLILGMMEARGVRWTTEEYSERVGTYLQALRALDEVAAGVSFDGIEIKRQMARIKGPYVDLRYSKAQLAAWDHLQAAYSSIQPVVDCVSDYRTVVTTALRLDALSAVPVKGSSHQLRAADAERHVAAGGALAH